MDRKRFRLKEGGGAAVLPIVRETGSGMAGGLGQKRFSLQKVSKVSGGLDAEKTIVHNSLSKVSNFSGDKDENQQPGGQEDELYAATQAELERLHAAPPKSPYLDDQGRLRIPCDCEPKYRWWQDGQSPFETALELGASDEELEHHVNEIFNPDDWRKWQEIKAARRAGAVSAKVSSSLANGY
jgi:hypothetical protein